MLVDDTTNRNLRWKSESPVKKSPESMRETEEVIGGIQYNTIQIFNVPFIASESEAREIEELGVK
jgi:hypothetical protein